MQLHNSYHACTHATILPSCMHIHNNTEVTGLCTHIGMISKSTGQILRVSAVMHALFNLEGEELGNIITPAAISAAIHFVEVCCQQTSFIAGRGELEKELQMISQGMIHMYGSVAMYTAVTD